MIFVAPSAGASGTFAGGSTSAFVETDAEGVAVAPTFYANSVPGGYAVEAESSGYASAIAFAMTNETLSTMTVSSVTPTVLRQGSAQVVTISGSGFQSGASVAFSLPGVRVSSITFDSAQTLTADLTISSSAHLGASDVTVTNAAGASATGNDVFTVSPLVAVALEPLQLGFSPKATALSGAQVRAIRQFARSLGSDGSLECVGYGDTVDLARARTLEVVRVVHSVDRSAHISRRSVVSGSLSKVTLEVP